MAGKIYKRWKKAFSVYDTEYLYNIRAARNLHNVSRKRTMISDDGL